MISHGYKKREITFRLESLMIVALGFFVSNCEDERCLGFEYAPAPVVIRFQDSETKEPICETTVNPNCRSSELKGSSELVPCLVQYPSLCEYRLYDWYAADAGTEFSKQIYVEVEGYRKTEISVNFGHSEECGELKALSPEIEVEVEASTAEE